ncbi:MAG TPA: UvrD-helicase domain-containing protein [Bacteroidales bacterium]|nr:UvrD-helicase domain-containing protein [Bacteroidales bacterium]
MSFEVFSSSAGSGKTFALVREYLKIVLEDPSRFRNILAVTFTNKAANEMKSRIIGSLTLLAAPDDPRNGLHKEPLVSILGREMSLSPAQITLQSQKVLTLILHHYSDFAVTTIDSFVYRILRTFAFDMQLPVDFDVELDTDRLVAKAVDLLISKAGTDDQITRLLVGFTEYKASEEYHWQIEEDLKKFSVNLITEDGYEKLSHLRNLTLTDFYTLRNKLFQMIRRFEETLSGKAGSMMTLIEGQSVSSGAFYYHDKGFYGFISRIAQGEFDKLVPGTYVMQSVEQDKWFSPSASDSDRKAIQSIRSKLIRRFRDLIVYTEGNKQRYVLCKILFQHIYPLALLHEIEKVISEMRLQSGAIHISEFNKRIAAIVLNEPVPFIYERLGEKFKHYLVDEFQDTSVLQWQNLLPLIENSLASGNFNMVVGDPKQSIYRWRNGEVEQFIRLPRIYRRRDSAADLEREMALERHYHKNVLRTNYRSREEIVQFNNSFFRHIRNLIPENLTGIYDDVEQQAVPESQGGYVHIEFYNPQALDEDFGQFNARRVAEIIDEVTADGYPLAQVAILCRSNDDASSLARYLLENGIQVISSESLLLRNSPEIVFLTSLLTYLCDPDPVLELAVVRYLVQTGKITEEEWISSLVRNAKRKEYNPFDFFDMLRQNRFDFDPDALIRLPIYELLENLIRIFSLSDRGTTFIQFFLDAVLDFTCKTGNDLEEFLEWWEDKKKTLSIIAPAGSNGVQIMTIHKAKGLQFPVVIYPFAGESLRMTKRYVWVDIHDPEISELRTAVLKMSQKLAESGYQDLYDEENSKSFLDMVNILYVVLTRASERLYVITRKPGKTTDQSASIPAFFYQYLVSGGLLTGEELVYEAGKKMPGSPEGQFLREKDEQADKGWKKSLGDWRQIARLRFRAPEQWDTEHGDRNREWGNLVHLALSNIITLNDIPLVTTEMYLSGKVTQEQKKDLDRVISNIIHHPLLKPYFDEALTVKTESEILLPSGQSYRPDRMVLMGDRAVVMDYKTGSPSPEHHRQLQIYGRLLHDMGYEHIEQYLIYLDDEVNLVKVN